MTNRTWLSSAAVLLAIASAVTVKSFQANDQATNTTTASATYVHGVLRAAIPYRASRSGPGSLTIEILNPEDDVLARSEQHLDLQPGPGLWHAELHPTKNLPTDEIVWHRLRYRFTYDEAGRSPIRGVEAISEILRVPALRIIGQNTWMSGAPVAVRVIAVDSKDGLIPGGAGTVTITLRAQDGKTLPLYSGRLNQNGTAEAAFHAPAGLTGTFPVHYVAETSLGSVEFTQQVQLQDQVSTLLTTEKPIYQPGQTIHARALALNRASHEAVAMRKLTFELEDSRGNKIFRTATQTSAYGVASAEFALADEVNLGAWHLRAILDGASAPQPAELTLNVQRYVLPKFKVAVEFANSDQKTKRGYRPGDHVTGTVQSNYFFGKPVDNAEITVAATAPDLSGKVSDVTTAKGTTDNDGAYHFDLRLPDYFTGHDDHGIARVAIEARVKDNAAHSETHAEPITVSESPLLLTAVPESGSLIPHLENRIYILASYPDGTPAKASIVAKFAGNPEQTATTDAGGIAIVQFTPQSASGALTLTATDDEGNHTSTTPKLDANLGDGQILLHTERAVYKIGDRIQFKVLSTARRGAAYIDIVKDGQTMETRDVDFTDGIAELNIPVTAAMSGTLDCNAYMFAGNARIVADHRLIFVQPADELKVEATTDAAQYIPGAEARIQFKVTNSRGEGVQAALGVQAVDEAVFALAEKQPGLAKMFFYLEQEAMKPRYEIHSVGMPDVLQTRDNVDSAQHNRAALALFSATEMTNANRFETRTGGTAPVTKLADYRNRYQQHFLTQVNALAKALSRACAQTNCDDLPGIAERLVDKGVPEMFDPWGHPFAIDRMQWIKPGNVFMVRASAMGPIGIAPAYLTVRDAKVAGGSEPQSPGEILLTTEHDRGPMTALAEATGSVFDPTEAPIVGAQVTLTSSATGTSRTLPTDQAGRFTFSAVQPADYSLEIHSPGFKNERLTGISLKARDRAVVTATLSLGSVSESVMVTGAPGFGEGFGRGGGGGGGAGFGMAGAGGVIGGIIGGMPAAAPPPRQFVADGIALNGRDLFGVMKLTPGVIDTLKAVSTSTTPEPHVRSWFPEALYINPEIITDATGAASITIPIADSITTWRMAMLASTTHGALGSGSANIKVFQDFFTDLDLPVTLTQGDRVEIPVAIYNYTGAGGNVQLQLKPDDWYALSQDTANKTVTVDSDRVGAASFAIEARRIGKFKLTLNSRIAGPGNHADIVVREIEVVPNGQEKDVVFNGHLETSVEQHVDLPADAIPDASKIFVRLYPGPMSQIVEGMDAILRMPGGCFEQTSSSTYPNILVLDYMKRTKKITPEIRAKAEGFIANGYQRLLTFEVPGGGFSWFGQAPANKILTAYGLMEFNDMSKVYDVDPNIIRRTQAWLAGQQQPDGSWKPDTNFINEGATNRYNSDVVRITAYIAWSLENTGYKGNAVDRARAYIESNMEKSNDAYTKAVIANFAADSPDAGFTTRAMSALLNSRTQSGDNVSWTTEETNVYGRGDSAAIETTGLAVQALLKSNESSEDTRKAVSFISSKKDATGAWGTTQATIMALRALLLASEKGGTDARGTVEITIDGKPVQQLAVTADNSDLFHQFIFNANSSSDVAIRFTGKGSLAYQVAGRYFEPWTESKPSTEALSIDVAYDHTHLAQDDIATATATVHNNLNESANMVMVDLGIPPGFDLLSEDLQDLQEKTSSKRGGRLEKFSLTATQAILYFDSIPARDTLNMRFRLRAKYPIRAQTFESKVYEYYQPEINAIAKPVPLEVVAKTK